MRKRPPSAYTVIDLNLLRDGPTVRQHITRYLERGNLIVLPGEFVVELTKGSRLATTAMSTLRVLAEVPAASAVAWSSKFLIQYEARLGEPVSSILSIQMTNGLRDLLGDVRRGGGAALAHWVDHGRKLQPKFSTLLASRKSTAAPMVAMLTRLLSKNSKRAVQTALQRGNRQPLRDFLAQVFRQEQLKKFFAELPDDVARSLSAEPSASALHYVVIGSYCVEWAIRGGFSNAKSDAIANDISDLEFVLTALYANEFVTKDRRARERYEDAKAVAALVWPKHAALFE